MKGDEKKELYDFIIVGAGIAGLSSAYHLLKDGYSVLVIEKDNGLQNASFNSTATMSHDADIKWDYVIGYFGIRGALDLWELSELSMKLLKKFAHEFEPHFNTERLTSYIYSNSKEKTKKLKNSYEIYKKIGVAVKFEKNGNLIHKNFDSFLTIPREGQTNNQAIIKNLRHAIRKMSGKIILNTPVAKFLVENRKVKVITTKEKVFEAKQLIITTGYNSLLPDAKFHTSIKRTFVVSFKKHNMPKFFRSSVLWDNEKPYHYIRSFRGNIVWVGGNDVDEKDYNPKKDYYKNLEQYSQKKLLFDKSYKKITAWNGTFYTSKNSLPYIYKLSGKPIYVNFGFGGTGILTSFISGYLISSWLKGKNKKYQYLFKSK